MIVTIDIQDNVADKVLYFLNGLSDIKVIKQESPIKQELDIEIIDENDSDYQIILKGREDRKLHPENYISEDNINWD